jgi:hypothetical protein
MIVSGDLPSIRFESRATRVGESGTLLEGSYPVKSVERSEESLRECDDVGVESVVDRAPPYHTSFATAAHCERRRKPFVNSLVMTER